MAEIGPLTTKMREAAKRLPEHAVDLTRRADELDAVLNGNEPDIRKLLGAWARARRAYTTALGIGIMDDLPG